MGKRNFQNCGLTRWIRRNGCLLRHRFAHRRHFSRLRLTLAPRSLSLPWIKKTRAASCNSVSIALDYAHVRKPNKVIRELAECPHPDVCPLAQVCAGTAVIIKQLSTAPDVAERLREMGVYEEQELQLMLKGNNLICRVCNARVGISTKLAERIMVKPLQSVVESK
jgi:Fe2+ transport system protein FeoA